jgi:glucokinase
VSSILIADIGGTNARFAIVDDGAIHGETYLKVADFPGPVQAARHYLAGCNTHPARAAFAVAGPVTGADAFELTNHPWRFSIEAARQALDLAWLKLINDFHAVALGVLDAAPGAIRQIGGGTAAPNGNIGILGPGTGLGMASLVWDPQHGAYVAASGEGAHSTVPVSSAREFALTEWLRREKYSHVSVERVCSGKGLANLYHAIRGVDGLDLPELTPEDITARALRGECEACREALTLMLGFLGRVAGNLALTINATGGIYFAGGILPQLGVSYVENSRLRGSFTAKGRFTAYVDRIPTFLIEDPFLPLKGLRRYALSFAEVNAPRPAR